MKYVSIPLPPRALAQNSSNKRGHWGSHHKATVAYQNDCEARIRAAKLEKLPIPVVVQCEWFLGHTKIRTGGGVERIADKLYRPRDGQNANGCLKCVPDLLKRMGLIEDDDYRRFILKEPIIHGAKESGVSQGIILHFYTPEEWRAHEQI